MVFPEILQCPVHTSDCTRQKTLRRSHSSDKFITRAVGIPHQEQGNDCPTVLQTGRGSLRIRLSIPWLPRTTNRKRPSERLTLSAHAEQGCVLWQNC